MSDLVHAAPADIDALVRERIAVTGRVGAIISSSNSLTDDMKPENIIAMREAINKYG